LTIDATNDNIYLGIAYEVSHLEAVMSPPKRSWAVAFNHHELTHLLSVN
jgi:hypothetical protein